MEASRSPSKVSTGPFMLDMMEHIESSSHAVQSSQNAMHDYQGNRGWQFGKNTCRTEDYYSSNTSVVEIEQSGNTSITWASSSSSQTMTVNSSPQYINQTNLPETELPIFQSVVKQQDTQNQPPTPPSPWLPAELDSLFPNSSFCPSSPTFSKYSTALSPAPCPISPTSTQYSTPLSPAPCPISPISTQYSTPLSPAPCLISPTYPQYSTPLLPAPCPISPTSPQFSTLHTPALNPTSPTSSQYPAQLATLPFSNLPASSRGPSLPPFSSIFSQSSVSQSSDINNLQVSHNQSSHQQPNLPTFQNCGQVAQLSQPVHSSISQMGITNMVNPTSMATEVLKPSTLKQEISHQDLLSKRRDCAHEQQQMGDTQFSQVHQNNLQFADINLYGCQHGNEMQQRTLQWEHQNPQIQGSFQGHQHDPLKSQQNYPGPQQNLPEIPHMSQQNAQMCIQSQHKTPYPIHIDQQPQQALENHQTIPWQSQNSHNNQQYTWQNLQTNQQNALMTQQSLQINLENALQPLLNCQRNQQNILDPHQSYLPAQPDQKFQALQQNTLLPQQNFQMNQQNVLKQQNVWTNQQDQYQPQYSLQTDQQKALLSQQNLQMDQQNTLQQQQIVWTNQHNPYQSLATNQPNTLQKQNNLGTFQEYPYQSQQNLLTNQQNLMQQQHNLGTNQQNSLQQQHNLGTNHQNSLQQQHNLGTNQQNSLQQQHNLGTNQQNSLQQQHNLGTNQYPCQPQQNIQLTQQTTWQLQQSSQTNQQNTLQLQQNCSTIQQNPWQVVQYMPTNQENPYQLQQISQNHQQNGTPSQQNLQANQPCLSQFNLETNQHSILKEQQNTQNLESTWRYQHSQLTMHPSDKQSRIELSTQQEQAASNLLPVNRDPIVLNCAAASVSHHPETVQEQVTSRRLPTGHLPSSSSTELLKYLNNRNQKAAIQKKTPEIPCQLCYLVWEFISQKPFQNQHSLESISYADIQNNPGYIQFLRELTNLGQMAKIDLSKLEKYQQQHLTSMLTDNTSACVTSSMNPMETGQQMSAEGELLCEENKWEKLLKAADLCYQKVNKLASNINKMAREWFEDIQRLCKQIEVKSTEPKLQNKCSAESKSANCLSENQNLADHVETLTAEMFHKIKHNSLVQNLSDICDCLIDFMKQWRCLEARKYVKLTLTPDENDVKKQYAGFGAILQKIFLEAGVKSNICAAKEQLYMMRRKLLSISWFYEKQPLTCWLTLETKTLYVRLFGVAQSDIDKDKLKIYVFPQANHEKRFDEQYLWKGSSIEIEECKSDSPADKQSVGVAVNLGHSNNFKRPYERNSSYCFEQMHRVCLVITLKPNLKQEEFEQIIECWSLPFAVRTGSEQLWGCEAAVTWLCYFEDNLYKLPPTFTQTSTIDQILCMLQAFLSTRDPERVLNKDEILSLKLMIKSVSKSSGNEINLREFVKEHVNSHGEQPTKKGKKQKENKQGKQQTRLYDEPTSKKHTFPFFPWFMAAVNSYMFVKSCKLSGSNFFLHPELCPAAKDVLDGSALIRTSTSCIERHCSKTPYANLTVHIYSGRRSSIKRVAIESTLNAKPEAFLDWLQQVKNEENVKMIRTILPHNTPLEELIDPCHDEIKINNYGTRSKDKQVTISTIIMREQFEAMRLDSDNPYPAESPYDL